MSLERYLAACRAAGGDGWLPQHEALWGALHEREAWYPELDGREPAWCFGLEGACTIAVTVQPHGLVIYVHADDQEIVVDDVEALVRWLDVNEPEPGFTPLQNELFDQIAGSTIERWRRDSEADE